MNWSGLTDREIAQEFARRFRAWRINPNGPAITQTELAARSGVGLTPLKRFEKTGGITLVNLIALLRVLNLVDGLLDLVPQSAPPSPLELLKADRAVSVRKRAPRAKRKG